MPQRTLDSDRNEGRFAGFVAVVRGASSGIDESVAERLAHDGASVCINYHAHSEPAHALVDRICAGGRAAIAVSADVAHEGDVFSLFDQTIEAFGRVDILVANSGAQKDAPIASMTIQDWKAVIDLDLTGWLRTVRIINDEQESERKTKPTTLGATAPEVNKTKACPIISSKRSQANPARLGCDISSIAIKQCGGEPDA